VHSSSWGGTNGSWELEGEGGNSEAVRRVAKSYTVARTLPRDSDIEYSASAGEATLAVLSTSD
jgi:hypothetical protein